MVIYTEEQILSRKNKLISAKGLLNQRSQETIKTNLSLPLSMMSGIIMASPDGLKQYLSRDQTQTGHNHP